MQLEPLFCQVSTQMISRIMRENGKPWRRVLRKIKLTQEKKDWRVTWCTSMNRKYSKEFFEKNVLVVDEHTFKFHNSQNAKKVARSFTKTGGYMDADEKVERPAASRYKHRQGYTSVKLAVTVGNGKIRTIDYYQGDLTKEEYVQFFDNSWLPAMEEMAKENKCGTDEIYFYRDNDPKSRDTSYEALLKKYGNLKVILQPVDSPDVNCLDYSIWNKIEKTLIDQDDEYEARTGKQWKETIHDFFNRVTFAFWSLDEQYIRNTMGSVKRRFKDIIDREGDILPHD